MTEPRRPNKSSRPRPLADLLRDCLNESFAKQGFASAELVTRWTDIVGPEISAHAEPLKIQWPRGQHEAAEPATLVLRVEGPIALEIQHLAGVIVERVNRFFGWQAIGRIALRQAPLTRRERKTRAPPDMETMQSIAASLPDVTDDDLRQALARLGAAVEQNRRSRS
jgi:hypothetical protein